MKLLHLLIVASLAANLALAAILFQKREKSGDSARPAPKTGAVVAATRPATGDASSQTAAAEAFVAAAKSSDAAGMRDQLRALGLSDDVIRNILRAVIMKRFNDIQKGITGSPANNPYWRPMNGGFGNMTKEQRTQLREASRAATKQLEELMGPDPGDPAANRFAFLPPEKAAKARDLERDYNDLRAQIMTETEGFRVSADDEKIAFLEKEQRKDLAALLSPEELEAFDLRNSTTANRLRYQLRDLDLSEAEYKNLYAAQKALDDKFAAQTAGNPAAGRDQAQARTQAQQQLNAAIKTALGDDRFNAYLRSQNSEYRSLESAAKRFNLPQTTVDQVYSTREQTISSAQRIASDANLNPDQRRQALTALADQTRAQVRTSLGPDVADSYLKNNLRWLDSLQQGQSITVTPEGNVFARPSPPIRQSINGRVVPDSSIPPPLLPPSR